MRCINTVRSARRLLAVVLLAIGCRCAAAQTVPEGFAVVEVVNGLDENTVAFASLPDGRILLASQTRGTIKLAVSGLLKAEPVITVPNLRVSFEQGLLGIAVDPDYPDSNYVYVFYSVQDAVSRVSRYTLEGDLSDLESENLTIDSQSERVLVEFPDTRFNHNGGTLRFGADKTLYISHGEDAQQFLAQDLTRPNGKIFRINRDGTAPPDNPTFDPEPEGRLPGIYAMGLRNPFRFSVDLPTGELFIGDVGPEDIEELNISRGGENFGWPRYLGDRIYQSRVDLGTNGATFPIHSYPHTEGRQAVTALVTYRQVDYPNDGSFPMEFEGAHFFADFYAGPIQYLKNDGDGWIVTDFATGFSRPIDGALASDGGIYVLEFGKALQKIVYDGMIVAIEPDPSIPGPLLSLDQNYPNPFSSRTRITYKMREPARTTVDVLDVLGRHIVRLHDAIDGAGMHVIEWDGRDRFGSPIAPGVYLYRVNSGSGSRSRVMAVVR